MQHSERLFNEANQILVGGVNSPVRAFKSVGGTPVFIKEGQGAYLRTEDDQLLIDYVLAWGPMLLGHADPEVSLAIAQAAGHGTAFGAPGRLETELATLIQGFFPSMAKIRFVNSGTEATMSALRVARGFTKRSKVIKFSGCYHGHVDSLLVSAGSGGLTFGEPDSDGVPREMVSQTLVLPFNDVQAISDVFRFQGDQIAAVIVEPVCGNMGVVLPDPMFLTQLRALCTRYQAVLIFDEVMTGFRVHAGGAQALYGVIPDLTCLGKVIGGGLPCGAYGGRTEIMACVSPVGKVYQAGTMSGNPVVMAAGIATLTQIRDLPVVQTATAQTTRLVDGMRAILAQKQRAYTLVHCGTMFSVFFCEGPVTTLKDTQRADTRSFSRYYHEMLSEGIYLAPSAFESNFMSWRHSDRDIHRTLVAFEKCV